MFVLDQMGNLIFIPRTLCAWDGDGEEGAGGGTGDGSDKGTEGTGDAAGGADKGEGNGNGDGDKGDGGTEAADWTDGLTEDQAKFAKTSPDIGHVIDRAREMQAKLSSSIRVPGKDAPDEEIASYRKAVGIPEEAKDYAIAKPEHYDTEQWDNENVQARLTAFREAMHAVQAPDAIVQTAVQAYFQMEKDTIEAQITADKEFAESQDAALKQRWGAAYDKNRAFADRAAAKIFGSNLDEVRKIVDKSDRMILDRPELLEGLATVGREMAEGGLVPQMSDGELDTAKDQLDEILAKIEKFKAEGNTARANEFYIKEQALRAKMSGNAPIVGAEGRTV